MKINQKIHIGCIVGTRPEIIKMAPVIFKLRDCSWATVSLINTAQHRGLLDDMLEIFGLTPNFDLDIMVKEQSLGHLTGNLCIKLDDLIQEHSLQAILAVGDTTTVFVSSLIAFYHRIPFGHIEAGLRTFDKYQPFPEEINRVLVAPLATWHFAPTQIEKENLMKESINQDSIKVTGNTIIDALNWVFENRKEAVPAVSFKRIIVVTAHRRENQGKTLKNICKAILILSTRFVDIDFIFPVHPNPNVQKVVNEFLAHQPRIHLISPLKYDEFVHLMQRAVLILTDSGGIQEEASALHKPVVIMRKRTERTAIIREGLGILAGTETDSIVRAVSDLLTNKSHYEKMTSGTCPFGDGHAAEYIVEVLGKALNKRSDDAGYYQ